jgi:hypothetical protein
MSIIEVGGAQSVGKSTTIEAAAEIAQKPVDILKRSKIIARILGVPVNEIHDQDPADFSRARQTMHQIIDGATNGVRDSHFYVETDRGVEFPIREADFGLVSLAVLITASPETVQARRLAMERMRATDLDTINRQLELEKKGAELFAEKLDVPLITLENDSGQEVVARQLAELFDIYLD